MKNYLKIIFLFLTSILLINPTLAQTSNNDLTNYENIREQAKILYIGNQHDQAQKHINTIPDKEKQPFDYYLIGLTSKDYKFAIKAYEQAIALDEKYYQAYFNLAEVYFNLQNFDKAIENYKLAIKYKKDFAYAHYNLGCVYLETKDYNNARKSFESAIKINPKEPDYYYNLGYTYKKMNNEKRATKALSLYNELIKERTAN